MGSSASLFLFGLGGLVSGQPTEPQRQRAAKAIEQAFPAQKTLEARAEIAKTKSTNNSEKQNEAIKTNNAAEQKRPDGKPEMVAAAAAAVAALKANLDLAQAQLDADNDDLAIETSVVTVKASNLGMASAGMDSSLGALANAGTASAKTMKASADVLLLNIVALQSQIKSGAVKAGDEMAVHLKLLALWRQRVGGAVDKFSPAVAAWGATDSSATAVALKNSIALLLANITALETELASYEAAATLAQVSFLQAQAARARAEGAEEVRAGVAGPAGSGTDAIARIVGAGNRSKREEESTLLALSQANFAQEMRRRVLAQQQ